MHINLSLGLYHDSDKCRNEFKIMNAQTNTFNHSELFSKCSNDELQKLMRSLEYAVFYCFFLTQLYRYD